MEVDCHFMREKVESRDITYRFVNFSEQVTNIFTELLRGPRINHICSKLSTYDLYVLC